MPSTQPRPYQTPAPPPVPVPGPAPTAERAAVLCGLGGYLPPGVVTNEDLAVRLDTSDTWIRTRTGIGRRHVIAPGQATSDLAVAAARRALNSAAASAASAASAAGPAPAPAVDALIVATTTPDRPCPATAPLAARALGLDGIAAFDVQAVCTGFVYGLATAAGLIAAGVAERVLVVGADAYSTIVDPADRSNAVVFGDGAGAVVLRAGRADEPGAVGHFDLGSDGAGEELITVAAGGSRQRSDPAAEVSRAERHFAMRGRAVYRHAVARMTASARTTLARAGHKIGDVGHFVPHQANARILRTVAEELGLPWERCVTNVESTGNTGAASIPLALAQAAADRRLRPGATVLLTAFGGGLTWGSCLLTWPELAPVADPHDVPHKVRGEPAA